MLDEGLEDVEQETMDEASDQLNLLEQLEKLNLDDEKEDDDEYKADKTLNLATTGEKVSVKEAARGHLKSTDPVFQKERASSKVRLFHIFLTFVLYFKFCRLNKCCKYYKKQY